MRVLAADALERDANLMSRKMDGFHFSAFLPASLTALSYIVAEFNNAHHIPEENPLTSSSVLDDLKADTISPALPTAVFTSNLFTACTLGGVALALGTAIPRGGSTQGGAPKKARLKPKAREPELKELTELAVGIATPIFATLQVGVIQTMLFIACAASTGLYGCIKSETPLGAISSRKWTIAVLGSLALFDTWGQQWSEMVGTVLTYGGLLASTAMVSEPSALLTGAVSSRAAQNKSAAILLVLSAVHWAFSSATIAHDELHENNEGPSIVLSIASSLLLALSLSFSTPRLENRLSNPLAPLIVAAASVLATHFLVFEKQLVYSVIGFKLSAIGLSWLAIMGDLKSPIGLRSHGHHDHDHGHSTVAKNAPSAISQMLISACTGNSLLHSILVEKDSRRIFYFML